VLVPPPGHHQPGRALVGRLEQLEPLEPVLVVHGPGPGGEPPPQLVAGGGGNGDRVDLDDGHDLTVRDGAAGPKPAAPQASSTLSWWPSGTPWRMKNSVP